MNSGRLFVNVYRWILLFLMTLAVEKGLDALAFKVSSDGCPFFTKTVVFIPQLLSSETRNLSYGVGILEVATLLMLMVRYFGCMVEPITQKCRDEKGVIDFTTVTWQDKLANVGSLRVSMVLFVTAFEFLFTVQAALALPDVRQWLFFIALLTLFDLCCFIVLPSAAWVISMLLCILGSFLHACAEGMVHMIGELKTILGSTPPPLTAPAAQTRREALHDKFLALRKIARNALAQWVPRYFMWTAFDVVIAIVGIGLTFTQLPDEYTVLIVFCLYLLVSVANMFKNRHLYKDHLNVLILSPAHLAQ